MRREITDRATAAYVAVLSTDSFLDGVLVLHESLRICRSKYKLCVVVGSQVSPLARETLVRADLEQIDAEPLEVPEYILSANEQSDYHQHWSASFDKLHVFSLSQFEKIVYIDSDVLVVRNIDELFDKPHMSATLAGLPGAGESADFSTGVMVIEPEPGLTEQLVALLPQAFDREKQWRTAAGRPMSIGDQNVINLHWATWKEQCQLHLDPKYNVLATHLDFYLGSLSYRLRGPDPIRVLHFDGESKPWMRKRLDFYHQMGNLLVRRRPWELAALMAYKGVLQSARLRLALSR